MRTKIDIAATCDGVKDCGYKVESECGCSRCDSEPTVSERFHTCAKHRVEATDAHYIVRGRSAEWWQGRLVLVEPPMVKIADRILLATERRDLMPPSKLAWRADEQVEPLPERIVPMSPALAERAFLDRFEELRGRR